MAADILWVEHLYFEFKSHLIAMKEYLHAPAITLARQLMTPRRGKYMHEDFAYAYHYPSTPTNDAQAK
jgi:hypothetical protein